MVTLYRFLPESDSIPVFVQSLQPEMSDAVKIAAVKACITLVVEVSAVYIVHVGLLICNTVPKTRVAAVSYSSQGSYAE